MQAGVSVAATIFGAILGRKAVSASTLGRATTAARGYGRVSRASQDVARAEAEVTALREKRDQIAQALEQELQTIAAQWDAREDAARARPRQAQTRRRVGAARRARVAPEVESTQCSEFIGSWSSALSSSPHAAGLQRRPLTDQSRTSSS